jgi:hypothetical protein
LTTFARGEYTVTTDAVWVFGAQVDCALRDNILELNFDEPSQIADDIFVEVNITFAGPDVVEVRNPTALFTPFVDRVEVEHVVV